MTATDLGVSMDVREAAVALRSRSSARRTLSADGVKESCSSTTPAEVLE